MVVQLPKFRPPRPPRGPTAPASDPNAQAGRDSEAKKAREQRAVVSEKDITPDLPDAKTEQFRERFVVGTPTAHAREKLDAANTEKPSETQQAQVALAAEKILSSDLRKHTIALGADMCTSNAQREFVGYVKKVARTPDELYRVLDAVRGLRNADPTLDLSEIDEYLRSQGLRLNAGEKPVTEVQLDRGAFREYIGSLLSDAEAGPVTIDHRMARELLARLSSVDDRDDLKWAHWGISRAVLTGKIKLEDRAAAEMFGKFFLKKANLISPAFGIDSGPGRIERHWLGFQILRAREAGFDEATLAQLLATAQRIGSDWDSLFFMRRAFDRAMSKASQAATTDEEKSRLAHVAAEFHAAVDERLAGKFDSYSEQQTLRRLRRAGRISQAMYLAGSVASFTSHSYEEYAQGVRFAQARLGLQNLADAAEDARQEEREKSERREEQRRLDRSENERRVAETAARERLKSIDDGDARLQENVSDRQGNEVEKLERVFETGESLAQARLPKARTDEEVDTLRGRIAQAKQAREAMTRPARRRS